MPKFGENQPTITDRAAHQRDLGNGIAIEWIAVAWMVVEAVAAVVAGIRAHSTALLAFGIDSVIELVAGCALLWRLYVERNGDDAARVERAERTASWIVGFALLLLAGYIVVTSIVKLIRHTGAESSTLGILIAASSGLLMPFVAAAKKRIGRRVGSSALEADGSCSQVCAYMSWIVLAGVVATSLLGWWWIDAVAALALVYFVVHEGWEAVESASGK